MSNTFGQAASFAQLDSEIRALFNASGISIVDAAILDEHDLHWGVPDCYMHTLPSGFPQRGYKLHISVGLDQVLPLYNEIIPLLVNDGVYFKCACSASMVAMLNAGFLGLTQVGKIITIYPTGIKEFRLLCERLIERTERFVGPSVPSDNPVPDSKCLYYRYGEFIPSDRPDSRLPGNAIPLGITDPLVSSPHIDSSQNDGKISLIAGRFLIFDVMRQRGKGGVYKAYDFSQIDHSAGERPCPIILKEGRKYGERDLDGRDAQDRLRRQAQVMRQMSDSRYFVQCYSLIEETQRTFLSMEYAAGYKSLGARISDGERPSEHQTKTVLEQLADALRQLHQRGFAWNDLSSDNILVDGGWASIKISDVEEATLRDDCRIPRLGTPGFYTDMGGKPMAAWQQDIYALRRLKLYLGNPDKFAECIKTGKFDIFDTVGMQGEDTVCQAL